MVFKFSESEKPFSVPGGKVRQFIYSTPWGRNFFGETFRVTTPNMLLPLHLIRLSYQGPGISSFISGISDLSHQIFEIFVVRARNRRRSAYPPIWVMGRENGRSGKSLCFSRTDEQVGCREFLAASFFVLLFESDHLFLVLSYLC